MYDITNEYQEFFHGLGYKSNLKEGLKKIIENELVRKISNYKHTVRLLEIKYGLNFDEFKNKDIISQRNNSFEVENDFCEWEMAIDGINTIDKLLVKIRNYPNDNKIS